MRGDLSKCRRNKASKTRTVISTSRLTVMPLEDRDSMCTDINRTNVANVYSEGIYVVMQGATYLR